MKFVPKGPIDNNPALVQTMACLIGAKSLSEPMNIVNYTNPGYNLSLVDTLWNAGSYRQPLEQEGNPMT